MGNKNIPTPCLFLSVKVYAPVQERPFSRHVLRSSEMKSFKKMLWVSKSPKINLSSWHFEGSFSNLQLGDWRYTSTVQTLNTLVAHGKCAWLSVLNRINTALGRNCSGTQNHAVSVDLQENWANTTSKKMPFMHKPNYRKRGSASYIVRQWLLWEGERERERERDACDVIRYHAEIASDHAYDYLDGASTQRIDAFWACRVLECM